MKTPPDKVQGIAQDATRPCATPSTRKPYAKPALEPLGDFRDLTMGVSGGAGESGMGSVFMAMTGMV